MGRLAAALGVVAMGSLLATPSRASAASEPPLELSWTVPEGCPDREYVLGEVQSLLKGSEAASATTVRATVTIATKPGGLRLTLITRDADGEPSQRELDSTDCKALADSAALFIALAIDPDAGTTEEPAAPEPAPSPAVVPPPPPPSDRPEPLPPTPTVARDHGIALWAAPTMGIGASPSPVFGGVVGGGVLIGRVWTGLAAVVSPMQSYEIAAPAGHLLVSSYAVHPHAGVRLGARKWLELTGGIEIASVGASFDAISAPTPSRFLRLSPSVGAAMMVPVTHSVFVRLFATAMVPIVRPRYVVTLAGNDQELYRTALVLAQLGLGLEFRP